ncbi:nuclear transport factor 2 family protein [Streptomyces mirabilis]|uniref:nuclear transport factor 2 family protein n=1 Tax=Streptomyces mirabilis TaxID=68239 RepID=UPI00332A0DEC
MRSGLQTLRDLLAKAPDIHYDMQAVLADGDLVAVFGRVTGWGSKPVVVRSIRPSVGQSGCFSMWSSTRFEI